MAKKKNKPINVVRKNVWSMISVWWDVLVFGLIIPALFIVMSLDVYFYKNDVWAHVETEKTSVIAKLDEALEADIEVVEKASSDLKAENVQLENKVAAAKEEIATLTSEIDALKVQVSSWEASIAEMEEGIAQLNASKGVLNIEIGNLVNEIQPLTAQKEDKQATIDAIERGEQTGDLDALKAELALIVAELEPKEADLAAKEAELDVINTDIEDLEDQIKALEDKIASIEVKTAEKEAKENAVQSNLLDIASNEFAISKNSEKIENLKKTYGETIADLDKTVGELLASKDAREFDAVSSHVYEVGVGRTYQLKAPEQGGKLGLATGFIKSVLNSSGSLSAFDTIGWVFFIIAVVIILLVSIVRLRKIIIAKKTAWVFNEGVVVYKTGRIFSSEEVTRDMEYFPGMSVKIRRTVKGKIFNYGDVIITNGAGEAGDIVMTGVKSPKKVRDMLSKVLAQNCTFTANMMSPYKMYPQMYRHVLGGYPAYYYGNMQLQNTMPKQ